MKAVLDAAKAAAAEAASAAEAPAGERAAETEVRELHPLARRAQAKLEAAAAKGADLVQISGKGLFTVTASPVLAQRLGRLLSQLVRAVERRGWTTEDGETGLRLVPDGEPIGFELAEQNLRKKARESSSVRRLAGVQACLSGAAASPFPCYGWPNSLFRSSDFPVPGSRIPRSILQVPEGGIRLTRGPYTAFGKTRGWLSPLGGLRFQRNRDFQGFRLAPAGETRLASRPAETGLRGGRHFGQMEPWNRLAQSGLRASSRANSAGYPDSGGRSQFAGTRWR